jgi:hypothetical protein
MASASLTLYVNRTGARLMRWSLVRVFATRVARVWIWGRPRTVITDPTKRKDC